MNYGVSKPIFALAPMDDVTDTVFRRVVDSCAPADLYYTEFVNVDGLQSPGRQHLLKKLRFVPGETRLIAQLWGLQPDNFRKTAAQIADGTFARELGLPDGCNFAGVDLNMGCPAKSEVQNGTCSALIKNRPLAHDIIEATREGLDGRMPLSVKTRIGFNEIDLTWIEFLLEHDLSMLTVHGRTRKEMSKVPAHWDVIGETVGLRDKIAPDMVLIGNGDVRDREHGVELIGKYGVDGVMIGRGIFQNPYAFGEKGEWDSIDSTDRLKLYRRQVALFADTWRNHERPVHTLNKFCKIYVNGFDGAKELRERLMAAGSAVELLEILDSAIVNTTEAVTNT